MNNKENLAETLFIPLVKHHMVVNMRVKQVK